MINVIMNEQKPKILIVDDQLSVHQVFKGLLLSEGYRLTFVTDGQAALDCLPEVQPDTILLDVMMPGMDGFAVCRRLKADARWQHIPVILVTAFNGKGAVAQGLDAGADDFLAKPVNGLELRARVRSMLRIKKQFDELQGTLALREDLANMIVHDMRNPLTAIAGMSELLLLKEESLLPQQIKDITTIKTQAGRLNTFLNDMLLLAKMEQDHLSLNYSQVDLNELIMAEWQNHYVLARSQGINLAIDLPPQTQLHRLDSNLFQRLLDNLLSNAVKFSSSGGTVTLKLWPPSAAEKLRLQVLDEGPGVPEEAKANIFDRFKVAVLRKKNVSQIGLGLAFCKLVVDAHEGHISVADNDPTGAIFTVEI